MGSEPIRIVVMAKDPTAGAKTRLAPALDDAARAALARAFLDDKIDQVANVRGCAAVVAFHPPEAEPAFSALVGGRAVLLPQRGTDLGERLAGASSDVLRGGARGVLLVDADTPNLPNAVLEEAARALEGGVDVVLGPAWDGGYYLLGLRSETPALFESIPWSTSAVASATVAVVRRLGLSLHVLPAWYDVDRPADLDRLALDLRAAPRFRPGHPWRTAALLASHPSPAPLPRNEHWTTLSTRPAYANKWITLDESLVDTGGGNLTIYGVITAARALGVLPLTTNGEILLVRQFRYVARRFTWEMPTGGAHPGETLEEAADRELREETGFRARKLTSLGSFHTSKSVMDEVAWLYLGEDLVPASGAADETEQIELGTFPFEEALRMIDRGEIVDSMTIIALLQLARSRSLTDRATAGLPFRPCEPRLCFSCSSSPAAAARRARPSAPATTCAKTSTAR